MHLRKHLSYSNVVATLALVFAVGGGTTAFALQGQNTVDSGDIINQEVKSQDLANDDVRGTDLENDTATGEDVNEASLAEVPQAENADKLGTVGADDYQRRCARGAVGGFAVVFGAGDYPGTYTTASNRISLNSFNCASASAARARRVSQGVYNVCFPGNAGGLPFISPRSDGTGEDNLATWNRVQDAACAGGSAIEVRLVDEGGDTDIDRQDDAFSILVLGF